MLNYHYLCWTYELKPLISIHSQICVQKLVPALLLDGWTSLSMNLSVVSSSVWLPANMSCVHIEHGRPNGLSGM